MIHHGDIIGTFLIYMTFICWNIVCKNFLTKIKNVRPFWEFLRLIGRSTQTDAFTQHFLMTGQKQENGEDHE